MSGHRGGVQVLLKEFFSKAVYVHCNSHLLNLVLCTAAKVSGNVTTFFDIVNNAHHFFTKTQRHSRFIVLQKEMHPNRQCMELERSCDTRWSSKSGSVHKILHLLDVILEALAEHAESSGQTKIDAEQLIQTKKLMFLLVTFCKLFENSDFAMKGLQSSTLCVTEYISLIETLKVTFAAFRDNSNCDFDKVLRLKEELMAKHDIANWDVTTSRECKLPAKFHESVVTTTLGKTSAVKSNDDLRVLWNCILDRQIAELSNRIQENTYEIMRASASLLPGSSTFGMKEPINPLRPTLLFASLFKRRSK